MVASGEAQRPRGAAAVTVQGAEAYGSVSEVSRKCRGTGVQGAEASVVRTLA